MEKMRASVERRHKEDLRRSQKSLNFYFFKTAAKKGEKTETFTRHVEFMILPNEILNVI